ncbi:MAG: hypothetical protein DI527_00570 [Chelatococcus sp.]|nr:MAG: hypothetical protein DI527_00570 [Chelatococcus sp.]
MKQVVEARDQATGEVIHREVASSQRADILREIEMIRWRSIVAEVSVRPMRRGEHVVQIFGRSKMIAAAIRQMQEQK